MEVINSTSPTIGEVIPGLMEEFGQAPLFSGVVAILLGLVTIFKAFEAAAPNNPLRKIHAKVIKPDTNDAGDQAFLGRVMGWAGEIGLKKTPQIYVNRATASVAPHAPTGYGGNVRVLSFTDPVIVIDPAFRDTGVNFLDHFKVNHHNDNRTGVIRGDQVEQSNGINLNIEKYEEHRTKFDGEKIQEFLIKTEMAKIKMNHAWKKVAILATYTLMIGAITFSPVSTEVLAISTLTGTVGIFILNAVVARYFERQAERMAAVSSDSAKEGGIGFFTLIERRNYLKRKELLNSELWIDRITGKLLYTAEGNNRFDPHSSSFTRRLHNIAPEMKEVDEVALAIFNSNYESSDDEDSGNSSDDKGPAVAKKGRSPLVTQSLRGHMFDARANGPLPN